MDSETFKMRKQLLGDFYNEDRVIFLKNCGKIFIGDFTAHNSGFNGVFHNDTEVFFKKPYINSSIPFKNYYNLLKPFIYLLYSFTYREKFLKDSLLLLRYLKITYYNSNLNDEFNFNASLSFPSLRYNYEGFNFLNKIQINDYTKGINELNIKLLTSYYNINYDQYLILRGDIEDEEEEQEEQEEYIPSEVKIINSSQSFKSEECAICLTNPPNILFCNCGHLCLCSECEKLKISNKCPICKIENEIIRVLN